MALQQTLASHLICHSAVLQSGLLGEMERKENIHKKKLQRSKVPKPLIQFIALKNFNRQVMLSWLLN